MIVLDTDIILTDYRYRRDTRFAQYRQALDAMSASGEVVGITLQTLLEIVGILSHNVAQKLVQDLPTALQTQYQLTVFPNPDGLVDYAGCSVAEIVYQMQTKMSLGDAVQAVLLRKFAPPGSIFVTWNAKHFRSKIVVPVLTPEEWLQQQSPPAGNTP